MLDILGMLLDVLLWSWLYGDDDEPRWAVVLWMLVLAGVIGGVVWWFATR